MAATTSEEAVESQAVRAAETIRDAFDGFHSAFAEITRRARQRFEQCDWHGMHEDAAERLELYREYVAKAMSALQADAGSRTGDKPFWTQVKQAYSDAIADRGDREIAESFYNSVTMRVITASKSIDGDMQYVILDQQPAPQGPEEPAFRIYLKKSATRDLIKEILLDCGFECQFRGLDEDAGLIAEQIDGHIHATVGPQPVEMVDIAEPVFYRGKRAYLVGRVRLADGYIPLVIVLRNCKEGIYADAVLLSEDEVSIIFSFARSYFHADIEKPRALVRFLKGIMPLKPVSELYISLGYNKHGKTELYRDLVRHLQRSNDQFEIAPGERGMVMTVFTLPSYNVVFKIIKDRFDYPKSTTRQEVRNHYYLVFKHDRGGRLVDAQEFEHLRFDKSRFSDALLDELLKVASQTVSVEGDQVEIKHLYTERRLSPLNIYLHEVEREAAEQAVIDYGQAIKDLAYTNIFPGDILLKNFGVTRHGRVVFYDYDELCLLTDCRFREMPEPGAGELDDFGMDDYMMAEPWFGVSEQDVFPEELRTFLGLPPHLAAVFNEHHGELFSVQFWGGLLERIQAGEVIEVLPYRASKRLHPDVE